MADSSITRNAIADSLKELTDNKPFEKISVGEICEHCGITRKSFYYHFRDKYDLVSWIFRTEFMDKAATKEYKNLLGLLDDLVHYMYEQKSYYMAVLETSGQNSFRDTFIESFFPVLEIYGEAFYPKCPQKMMRSAVYFLASGLISFIKDWLNSGIDLETMIETTHYLLDNSVNIIRESVPPSSSKE